MMPPVTLNAILDLLYRNPDGLTLNQLADEIGKCPSTVHSSIRGERQRRGSSRIRIAGWIRALNTSGKPTPVYGLGPGRDVPRPPALTVAEKNARYRKKHAGRIRLMQDASRSRRLVGNPWAGLMR